MNEQIEVVKSAKLESAHLLKLSDGQDYLRIAGAKSSVWYVSSKDGWNVISQEFAEKLEKLGSE